MKALVLDGSREGDSFTPVAVLGMTSALAGREDTVELFKLRELSIAPCAGCFGCWTRTPGECVIEDGARDVLRSLRIGIPSCPPSDADLLLPWVSAIKKAYQPADASGAINNEGPVTIRCRPSTI